MELTFACREIDSPHNTQCQSTSVTDRNEDLGDRKQVVWEDVMEKVTFEPSPWEDVMEKVAFEPSPEEGEGRDLSISELQGN